MYIFIGLYLEELAVISIVNHQHVPVCAVGVTSHCMFGRHSSYVTFKHDKYIKKHHLEEGSP